MGRRSGLALLIALLAGSALAATIRVPEDRPNIQSGLDAAAAGDTVLLADGEYRGPGNRDLDFKGKAIVLRSVGGDPGSCLIDCEGSAADPHRAFHFHSGESAAATIEGLGITGGWWTTEYPEGGGGLFCEQGSRPTLIRCSFFDNQASAIYCRQQSGLELLDCRFENNRGRRGGAVQCLEGNWEIRSCAFIGNEASVHGGALHGHSAIFTIEDCVFYDNRAGVGAAVNMIYGCEADFYNCLFDGNHSPSSFFCSIVNLHGMVTGQFEGCTFVNNKAEWAGYVIVTSKMSHGALDGCTFVNNNLPNGTLIEFGESDGSVDNTIIAHNPAGRPLWIGEVLSLSCTDIFGNGDGDWVGEMEPYLGVDGNICADPLFCDPVGGDYSLHEDSPCLPGGGCGLMGAWPQGCGVTATKSSSWSRIKSLY